MIVSSIFNELCDKTVVPALKSKICNIAAFTNIAAIYPPFHKKEESCCFLLSILLHSSKDCTISFARALPSNTALPIVAGPVYASPII